MYKIITGETTGEQFMLPIYRVDDQNIKTWKAFFNILQNGTSIVFHDGNGKDQAGMTAALLLSALDVPRETIINDFLLSNRYMASAIEESVAGIDKYYGAGTGDKLRPMLGVQPKYIETFFTNIETKYGSVDNFITNVLGGNKNQMKKLYLN